MHEKVHGSVSHGYKVGVGSIASAALYERMLARDLSNLDIPGLCRNWPTRDSVQQFERKSHNDPVLADNAVEQSLKKYIDADQLRDRLELLKVNWSDLQVKLQNQMLTAGDMRNLLKAMGCPTLPYEIGKDASALKSSYTLARQIRSRYTIFDLAEETGCFAACVDEMFADGGFWSKDAGWV
jgi:glycerol-1-phosphate dehydrogenase [NAD(P)+]